MKARFYQAILCAALSTSVVLGMQFPPRNQVPAPSPALVQFCEVAKGIQAKGAKVAEAVQTALSKLDPDSQAAICKDANHAKFYEIPQVLALGTFKNRAIKQWCDGYRPDREATKGVQGAKKAAAVQKMPKLKAVEPQSAKSSPPKPVAEHQSIVLRPVKLERRKGQSVEEAQVQLAEAQKAVEENIQIIEAKRDPQLVQRVEALRKEQAKVVVLVAKAKESYDNLSVAVIGMREDIREFINQTWANGQDDKTPEEFVNNLEVAVNGDVIHLRKDRAGYAAESDYQTYERLKAMLAQARENYEAGFRELERINRELLELTH